ncbi:hypothetical protein OG599_09425 [Streptomyces sp. NBC_01335]|uniref:hypothetical protein n=1 Tax=Streptomyces sp. NBC_01335 TaxID=2903828 RepID=UPI002E11F0F8|nr:hypothetical protein OG599_09425 [Streptomyces sp. NBC_01335]
MGRRAKHVSSRRAALRLLGIPEKGQPHRTTALLGYGGLALSIATATALGSASATRDSGSPVTVFSGDAFTSDPGQAVQETLLDGAGGIAGVPLTEEQRNAVIREGERRGLSKGDAYALAYGDDAKIRLQRDGTVTVDTSKVVLANGPVYAKVKTAVSNVTPEAGANAPETQTVKDSGASAAPQEDPATAEPSAGEAATDEASPMSEIVPRVGPLDRSVPAGQADAPAAEPYYPDSGKNPYVDGLGDSLLNLLSPFTEFMDSISRDGSATVEQTYAGGQLVVTATSQVASGLEVAVSVAASGSAAEISEVQVSATVSNTLADEVLVQSVPTVVDSAEQISHAAIGEAVDAVVTAVGPDRAEDVSEELGNQISDRVLDLPVVAPLEPLNELGSGVELAEAA